MKHPFPELEAGLNIQARARPGPVKTFENPTNRQKMNLIRTLFVQNLLKHRPGPARFQLCPFQP